MLTRVNNYVSNINPADCTMKQYQGYLDLPRQMTNLNLKLLPQEIRQPVSTIDYDL
jgi:hypothetical protein